MGTSFLSSELDYERLHAMQARLRRARLVAYPAIIGALLGTAPWLGWWLLAVCPVLLGCWRLVDFFIPRTRHPDLVVAVGWLASQAVFAATAALTGGAASPALVLTAIMVAGGAARLSSRALFLGVAATGLMLCAASLSQTDSLSHGAPYLISALATLFGVAAWSGALVRSELSVRHDSVIDPLTGLLNRKALAARFAELQVQATQAGETVAVIACDLDCFKAINDQHGHDRGDSVLRDVAYVIRTGVRAFELVYRTGGEEILILLPRCDLDEAAEVAERLRSAVETAEPGGLSVTLSLGVSAARGSDVDMWRVAREADAALYRAKRAGRNRVCCHQLAAVSQPALGQIGKAV